jgi:hypothetical protein
MLYDKNFIIYTHQLLLQGNENKSQVFSKKLPGKIPGPEMRVRKSNSEMIGRKSSLLDCNAVCFGDNSASAGFFLGLIFDPRHGGNMSL